MLWGVESGALELRQGGDGSRTIAGRFPYRSATVLGAGPQPRREVFANRAFSPRIDAGENVHLLFGHDYNRPLASRAAGTLTLTDSDDALIFEARIAPEIANTTHGRDVLAMIGAGLAPGVSPGFRVPEGGASVAAEGDGVLRTVTRADLFELSVVVRPAYDDAQIEARNWTPQDAPPPAARPVNRRAYAWR